jgi:hypothetical protein
MSMTPEHDDAAYEDSAKKAAKGLAAGRPRTAVAQDLVADGWSQEDANSLVTSVEAAMQEEPSSGGGSRVGGWVLWLGALVVINLLSWAFDWPFWIY